MTSYNPLVVYCARALAARDPHNQLLIEEKITDYIKLSHEKPYSEEWKIVNTFLHNYMVDWAKKMGVGSGNNG